ncbi:ATP-binding protein [Hyphobacterium sp. HN65]|uniref:histidine kinase n=1 Tax=Hyphobacterium lacteum TaxID=3116575 RepID=A0ABU7LNI2_9PROT|nr:ATP-binding protein [Hyphobacterium sp. HN65]MEE2525457.1 ATP-binding protein [Hyphobacterium sp. HN65]
MSKDSPPESEGRRLRRRDTIALTAIAIAVLLILLFSGAISLPVALTAVGAIAAMSFIYYLLASPASPDSRPAEPDQGENRITANEASTSGAMLENLPFPVLLVGSGGRIERANPAAHEYLGLGSESGLLSASLRQPKVLEAVSSVLRGDGGKIVEYSTFAPIESHVRVHVIPLKSGDNGAFPWRALLVLADETASKRAERMRGDFLANASHELRTPLASLAGFIETLKGHAREDIEARDKFLNIMQDQTERMGRLINDLLSLGRVEMDEHVPPSGDTDLSGMTQDTIDSLTPLAKSKGITIDFEGDAEARVVGDRDQLFEIAQNLIENAIKYSNPNTRIVCDVHANVGREEIDRLTNSLGREAGRLTITSPALTGGRRYAILRVRDAGSGIERRHLPRLTERFYRVDGQKSGPKEGTGLGLAIVKHIISRHRGGFFVESRPGEGTVFSVCIPSQKARPSSGDF